MAGEIKVPALGESITSATVGRWLKKAGDAVARDEPLVELETDKVTVEVPAPSAGVLREITADAGAEVAVGAVIGRLEAGATASPAMAASAPAPAPVAPPQPAAPKPAPTVPPPIPPRPTTPPPSVAPAPPSPTVPPRPLPAAAKLLEERHVAATEVGSGSGKDGRLTKGDVLAFLDQPAAQAKAPAPKAPRVDAPGEERVRMTRLRRTIAVRLKEAQNTAAMLTTFNEADMSAVQALRSEYRAAFEKKYPGVRLGYMSFFARASIAALRDFPAVNAEIDGDDLIYRHFVNMGIAVGGANGLVVPVIRDIDKMGFADIERAVADLGARARAGTLKLEELAGGTFSITNGGVYGSLLSTPILNPPQSAILGMHKIQDRPVARDGKVEIRPMMFLALTYDHRVVDGREAVSFLVRVKEGIEDPRRLLLDL